MCIISCTSYDFELMIVTVDEFCSNKNYLENFSL